MTLKDYQKRKELMEINHRKELNLLAKEYALANNTVQVGDTITNKTGTITIKVKKIGFSFSLIDSIPECVYYGDNLTKAGTINKRDPEETIHQTQLKQTNDNKKRATESIS